MLLEKMIGQTGTIVPIASETSFWQMGTVVPLAIGALLVLFLVSCFFGWKKFLRLKYNLPEITDFSTACEAYITARKAYLKLFDLPIIRWFWIFGNHYLNLVSFCLQRAIYELDQIELLEEAKNEIFSLQRTSFMSQWKKIHSFLFQEEKYTVMEYKLKKGFRLGSYPFGPLHDVVMNKIYLLLKKQALFILRTKGFTRFCDFLWEYDKKHHLYESFHVPLSDINDIIMEIINEHDKEIVERLEHELKEVEMIVPVKATNYDCFLKTFIFMNTEYHHRNAIGPFRDKIREKIKGIKQ